MSTSEWEQRLKSLLEEQDYVPRHSEWERMQQALQPPENQRRSLWLAVPAWRKAAAAATLVLGAGTAVYYLSRPATDAVIPGTARITEQARSSMAPAAKEPQQPAVTATAASKSVRTAIPRSTRRNSGSPSPAQAPPPVILPETQPYTAQRTPLPQDAPKEQPAPSSGDKRTQPSFAPGMREALPYWAAQEPGRPGEPAPTHFGVAARIGKPSQGDVQYNVGFVVRRQLGKVLYAEASLAMAATNVRHSEQVNLPTGFENAANGYQPTYQSVDMRFAGNMLSVGLAPAIGIQATPALSVSLGGDLYKSLNTALDLQKNETFNYTNAADMGVALPARSVSGWDAGLRGQVEYKLNRKLSVNTQYRQGLTRYLQANGKALYNSAFHVGLKYDLNR